MGIKGSVVLACLLATSAQAAKYGDWRTVPVNQNNVSVAGVKSEVSPKLSLIITYNTKHRCDMNISFLMPADFPDADWRNTDWPIAIRVDTETIWKYQQFKYAIFDGIMEWSVTPADSMKLHKQMEEGEYLRLKAGRIDTVERFSLNGARGASAYARRTCEAHQPEINTDDLYFE